jgi:serine/threonine-protein kinase
MPLNTGSRVGSYEIVALIGAGGMGEVYRARDTRLKRDVAIKVLPDAFANDAERLARFQREAELLATLNHPNIGAVYGLEQTDSASAIVLELIEGETLADRLAHGALPIKTTLTIALQIAEALEAAHERGVVHRDLKPANIKITADDKVKVLDFGLAKALEANGAGATAGGALTHSPTLSMMATQAGMILGTAAYMSPEQAKGFPADQRSDIFSFGSVLYEMLTGRQPFHGDTAPDVLASVIVREVDFNALPPNLNLRLRELIERCLEKNPRKRWQAIGDLRTEMERIASAPAIVEAHAPDRPRWKRVVPLVATAAASVATVAVATWMLSPVPVPPIVTRFPVPIPETILTTSGYPLLALSPDGRDIVIAEVRRLRVRSMNDMQTRTIPGSEFDASGVGIVSPVFSPDGRWVGFASSTDRTLKKIAVTGGAAVTIGPLGEPFGISWDERGILAGQGSAGIVRMSPDGGTPEQVIKVRSDEQAHGPQLLPDGDSVLFTLAKGTHITRWETAEIVVQSIKSGARKTLVSGGTDARYLETGHLVYALRGVLLAVRFDLNTLTVIGGPVPVVEGVARPGAAQTGATHYSVSRNGSLIYIPGQVGSHLVQRTLALVDRSGAIEPLKLAPAAYDSPRVSPDGRQVAVAIETVADSNIWVIDISGALAPRRLTFGGRNRFPIWSSDGQHVAYQSDREGDEGIFWQRADGTGSAERLTKPEPGGQHRPDHWSPDGRVMAFTAVNGNAASVMLLDVTTRKAAVFAEARGKWVARASFAPDGKWIAYSSSENGIFDVFVQPYPATGDRYQVGSAATLSRPVVWWSPGGRELMFSEGPTRWFAVDITTSPTFAFGTPHEIPRVGVPNQLGVTGQRNFDQLPDGKRILTVMSGDGTRGQNSPEIQVVLNWFEELKQRVPTH